MKILLLTLSLIASINISAQEHFKIEYEAYDQLGFEKTSDFAKEVESSNKTPKYYTVLIDGKESYFQKIERINNTQEKESVSFSTIQNNIYINSETQTYQQYIDYNGHQFIINDSLPQYNWSLTRETKNILGQEVRKATHKTENTEITAWYAPNLPYKIGPIYTNGLPGLILELQAETLNKSEKHIHLFTAIKLSPFDKKDKILKPTKGKLVSKEEFTKEAQKITKKMMEMYQSGINKKD